MTEWGYDGFNTSQPRPPGLPRLCGGILGVGRLPTPADGLSPHTRGKLDRPRLQGVKERSIPACAGEIPTDYVLNQFEEDYPRAKNSGKHANSPLTTIYYQAKLIISIFELTILII